MDAVIPWPEQGSFKCRRIAQVRVSGKTTEILYFYGVGDVAMSQYPETELLRINQGLLGKALDCTKGGFEVKLDVTGQEKKGPTKAKKVIEKYATAMARDKTTTAACCAAGRERSALAVFSHLYVNHGVARDTARNLVVTALEDSYHPHHPDRNDHIGQTKAAIESVVKYLDDIYKPI